MNKTVEDYLNILYPNRDSLLEEEKKRFEKDKKFLTEYLDEVNSEYNKYLGQIDDFGEYRFTTLLLQLSKERFDKETIIVEYAKSLFGMLEQDSYISTHFETFVDVMHYERNQEEKAKDIPTDQTPITLEKVFELTEEFLSKIDDSQELVTEFRKLLEEGRIGVHSSDSQNRSIYKYGMVNYVFDGTINSVNTLVHEFMHHWVEIKAHPTNSRDNHTLLNEYISIYYENAFLEFMKEKGLLSSDREKALRADRLKREYSKDPNNCVLMFIDICQKLKSKGTVEQEDIIEVFENYYPDITDRNELWEKGSEIITKFCKEHSFTSEIISGPVMYRFNNGLAMQTEYTEDMMSNIFKLAPLIQDRQQDNIFMEKYSELTRKRDKVNSTPMEDITQSGLREGSEKIKFDRIPLSSCTKVKDESDIPGNFTSVMGEYFVPSENRTGFYKLNCSFGNNPDLRELLASILLKSIDVPAADIILVYDDEMKDNGCISMSILQEGEQFLPIDYSIDVQKNIPDNLMGLDRFIATDLYSYSALYNLPPELLEERRKFLIEYAFISAFLGNDDIKSDNCQMIFNSKTGTIRNPEYYDMGMSFEDPTISPGQRYPRYFWEDQLDMDALKELYEKYPKEVEEISKKIEKYLNKDYLREVLDNEVFKGLGQDTIDRIWANLGNKIAYISKQNELLYGMSHEQNSFITSLDEIEETTRGTNISLIDRAKSYLQSLKQKIFGKREK